MRTRTLTVVAAVFSMLVIVQPSWAESNRSSEQNAEKVLGYLQGYPGDCPPAEAPQDPYVCHEVMLSAWRIGTNDGPGAIAPPSTAWVLSAISHTLTFPGGGADPTESDVVEGFTNHPTVTFDQQHLSTAHLIADDIHMSDGTTLDVDATWTPTSDRILSGNNGPSLADFGEVRHLHQPCLNEINQGHQKYRLAHVHTLLNGQPVDDLSIFAFLAYNQFRSIDVIPASCR